MVLDLSVRTGGLNSGQMYTTLVKYRPGIFQIQIKYRSSVFRIPLQVLDQPNGFRVTFPGLFLFYKNKKLGIFIT